MTLADLNGFNHFSLEKTTPSFQFSKTPLVRTRCLHLLQMQHESHHKHKSAESHRNEQRRSYFTSLHEFPEYSLKKKKQKKNEWIEFHDDAGADKTQRVFRHLLVIRC